MKKKALKAQINLMVEDLHAKDNTINQQTTTVEKQQKIIEGLEAEVRRLELVTDSVKNMERKVLEDVVMVILDSPELSVLDKVHVYRAINRSKEFYIGGLRRVYAWVSNNNKAVMKACDLQNIRESCVKGEALQKWYEEK